MSMDEKIRGSIDIPLDDKGVEQAEELAEVFRDRGPLSKVYSSDLQRSMDTAKEIAEHSNAHVTKLAALQPWHLGNLEGMTAKNASPRIEKLTMEEPDAPADGRGAGSTQPGESFHSFRKRFLGGFQALLRDYDKNMAKRIGVVTHYRGAKLLDAWIANGAPEDLKVDRRRFLAHNSEHDGTMGPATVFRVYKRNGEVTAEPVKAEGRDRQRGDLPGGIYVIRHGHTPWNGKSG